MGEEGECTQLTHSKTEECLAHQSYSPDEFLMILAWVSYFCYGEKNLTSRKDSRVVLPCGTGRDLRPSIDDHNNFTLVSHLKWNRQHENEVYNN